MCAISVFEGALYAVVQHMFLTHRLRFDHRFFIMAGLSSLLLIGSAFLEMPFPMKSLLVLVVLIIVAHFLYNMPAQKVAFITIAVFYMNLMADLVVGNIISSIYNESILVLVKEVMYLYVIQAVAVHILQLGFAILIIQYFKRVIFNNPSKYWIILDSILVMSYLIAALSVAVIPSLQTLVHPFGILVVVVCFVAINSMVVYMFSQMSKRADWERHVVIQEAAAKRIVRDMVDTQQKQDELRKISHEWKNYNAALSFDLSNGNLDAALERIRTASIAIPEENVRSYTGNEVIDFVLGGRVEFASEKGIEVDVQCSSVGPVPAEQGDLISVIANLFDNAVEAAEHLSAQDRRVQVDCRCKDGYLLFTVENRFSNEIVFEGNRMITSKQDVAAHGYGITIARDICQKYAGDLHTSHDNGVFVARASFRI